MTMEIPEQLVGGSALRDETWQLDMIEGLLWNVHSGSPWPAVEKYLDDQLAMGRLDVIVLNEARNIYEPLRQWADKHGYFVRQQKPLKWNGTGRKPEKGSTAVLLCQRRKDLQVLEERGWTRRMHKPFKVFSHDQWHEPRQFEMQAFRTVSGLWRLQADHFPTLGFSGPNAVAFKEAARKTLKFLRNAYHDDVAALAVGDKNAHLSDLRQWFAERIRWVMIKGHNVDAVVAVGIFSLLVDVQPKGPSDHHALRFRARRRYNTKKNNNEEN